MASMVGDVVTAAGWAALREAGDGRVDGPAAAIRRSRMRQSGRASIARDIHTGCGVCVRQTGSPGGLRCIAAGWGTG